MLSKIKSLARRDTLKNEENLIAKDKEISGIGETVLEYRVGVYRVRVVRHLGELIYIVEPSIPQNLRKIVRDNIPDILPLLRRGSDVLGILSKVLGIQGSEALIAVEILREELRYRSIQPLIDDPYIEDISITGAGHVWVRHAKISDTYPEIDMIRTNIMLSESGVVELQQVIASRCNTYISTSNPIVDVQLPLEDGGHRVHMVAKTISNRPEIVVRKRIERIVKVEELAKQGSIPYAFIKYVESLINKRGSMIIAGPPGSGKTTLLRAILHSMIPGSWKIAIIEDTPEIDPLPGSSWTRYTSFELGRVKVDLFDLAKASLRSSATRLLVVGETRGAEAQVLTQAINTGMGALTTFHAGSPEEAIARLRSQPIGLSNSQVSMFWAIAIMGFQSATPRRILRSVAELIPRGDDPPEINVIYDRMRDGVEIEYDKLVMRSRRLSTLGDGDGSAKMV